MIYLASGIYRSASTWCFNTIRVALEMKYAGVHSGFTPTPQQGVPNALKWHDPIANTDNWIRIHSTRNYDECIESAREVLGRRFTREQLQALDDFWMPRANLILHHDRIRDYPRECTEQIIEAMMLTSIDYYAVYRNVLCINTQVASQRTQYHQNHRRNL